MKLRIQSILASLLAIVLLLALMPTAFAQPMTLVLEAVGDTNKEFVYYIQTTNAYIDPNQENVEKIEKVTMKKCNCGFTVFSCQENPTVIWRNHTRECGSNYINSSVTLNKITLKNGQTIAINTIVSNPTIYAVQEDGYTISYSSDGKNFIEYVNDPNIPLSETTVASIKFATVQDGTITIRRTKDGYSEPVNTNTNTNTSTNPYQDVSTGDWFYPAVEYMSSKGYMTGYSTTEFSPNDTLSRAMFVTVLYRISGEKAKTTTTNFTDVPQNTWYSEAVAWAVENEITSGTSATTFSPNNPVTREQMATFMKRYVDAKGVNMPNEAMIFGSPADMSASSSWAKDAVKYAYEYGLLLETDSRLSPLDHATRTDAVVAFYNLLCAAENGLLLPYEICNHNWATRYVAEVGHYESSGTHKVRFNRCNCGFEVNGDMPNADKIWRDHTRECGLRWVTWTEEVPNDDEWVIDTPAHDETYCTICGVVK